MDCLFSKDYKVSDLYSQAPGSLCSDQLLSEENLSAIID